MLHVFESITPTKKHISDCFFVCSFSRLRQRTRTFNYKLCLIKFTCLEFAEFQTAVENREKWRKLVVKSYVMPQRPSGLRDRWGEVKWGRAFLAIPPPKKKKKNPRLPWASHRQGDLLVAKLSCCAANHAPTVAHFRQLGYMVFDAVSSAKVTSGPNTNRRITSKSLIHR